MRNALFLFVLCGVTSAQAALPPLMQSASSMREKHLAAGGYAAVYLNPDDIQMAAHAVYGVTRRIQAEARLGLGTIGFYAASYGKFYFFSHPQLDVALWGGFHLLVNSGAFDFGMPFSHSFGAVEATLAPLFSALLSGGGISVGIAPGVTFGMGKDLSLYLEALLGLANHGNGLSLGARFLL